MAVKVSSVSAVTKRLAETAAIAEGAMKEESEYLSDVTTATFNGEVVYVKDYCPLCHGVVTVVDRDGKIVATTYNGKGSTVDGSSGGNALSSKLSESTATDAVNSRYKALTTNIDIKAISNELLFDEGTNVLTFNPNVIYTLNKVISNYMDKTCYDQSSYNKINYKKDNKSFVVDRAIVAEEAEKVDWEDIENKPGFSDDILVKISETYHEHNNLNALAKIKIDTVNDLPLWNDGPWPESNISSEHLLGAKYIRNIFTSSSRPSNANVGDVWFYVNSLNQLNGIYIKRDDNNWYSLTIERLNDHIVNNVIYTLKSGAISQFPHNEFGSLQGGDGRDQFYHLDADQYESTLIVIDKLKKQEIAKAYDGLDSDSTINALSAKQGKVLLERIEAIEEKLNWLSLQ